MGTNIAARLGWQFDPEIGEALRRKALARHASAHARQPQPWFDCRVFLAEIARDRERGTQPRVVETWHPGNLAYACRRSPRVALAFLPYLRAILARQADRVLVQPLDVGRETLQTRFREPGPTGGDFQEWMLEVGRDAPRIARDLGLTVLGTIRTDRCTVEQAVDQVCGDILSGYHGVLAARAEAETK